MKEGDYMSFIYDFNVEKRDGSVLALSELKGKILLVVNTATGCGFTPQYKELEELYEKYHDQGLEILDFPCNQFGNQAPGNDTEIHEFCQLKYDTKFDQLKKIEVNGENASPLYTYLKEQASYNKPKGLKNKAVMSMLEKLSNTKNSNDIKWNFTKFLISRDGLTVKRYEPVEKLKNLEEDIKKNL